MEEWYTHPNNKAAIEEALEKANGPLKRDIWNPLAMTLGFMSIPIHFDPNMQERDIEEVWHPPEDSRFCGYGPEDEVWMRPLRIGRFEYIDKGPLIYKVDKSLFFRVFDNYHTPLLNSGRFLLKHAGV